MLVQGTGSRKSSIPQIIAVVDRGVTIVIENTLAFGSDQQSMIANTNNYDGGKVLGIQLDEIKHKKDQQLIIKTIMEHMNTKSTTLILLFTSPETIAQPIWLDLIAHLIEHKILKLICINKVHLLVEFGVTFQPSFGSLKDKLFHLITNYTHNNSYFRFGKCTLTLQTSQGMLAGTKQGGEMHWSLYYPFREGTTPDPMRNGAYHSNPANSLTTLTLTLSPNGQVGSLAKTYLPNRREALFARAHSPFTKS